MFERFYELSAGLAAVADMFDGAVLCLSGPQGKLEPTAMAEPAPRPSGGRRRHCWKAAPRPGTSPPSPDGDP